jgi:hypothetical protein
MRQRNRLVVGVVAGMVLSLAAVLSVLATYGSGVAATISVTGPAGNQSCGTTSTIHALILDTLGAPVTDVVVDWTFAGGNIAGDHLSPTSSTTNSSGIATTQVTFACPGSSVKSNRVVTIDASNGGVLGSISVTVTVKGLPSTSTDPASDTSTVAILAAAFAVLLGSWIILRRVSATRS